MNETVKLALSKLSLKPDRDAVASGKHDIDVTVNVKGTVTVGQDYETTPTVSVLSKATVAHLLRLSGITRDVSCKLLRQAMQAAMDDEVSGETKIREMEDIDASMKLFQTEVLSKLPKMTKKGPVTVKLTVTEVT